MGRLTTIASAATTALTCITLAACTASGDAAAPSAGLRRAGAALEVTLGEATVYAAVHPSARPSPFVALRFAPNASTTGEHHRITFVPGGASATGFEADAAVARVYKPEATQLIGAPIVAGEVQPGWAGVCTTYVWRSAGRTICTEQQFLGFRRSEDGLSVDVGIDLIPAQERLALSAATSGGLLLQPSAPSNVGGALNSEGEVASNISSRRARWVRQVQTAPSGDVGVSVFDHPTNPRAPSLWERRANEVLALEPFGELDGARSTGGVYAEGGQVVRLFYRVLVHDPDWTAERIDAAYRAWVRTFPTPPKGIQTRAGFRPR